MNKQDLLEIYKVEADKYNKTRDIQWKMNVAIWSLLIAATYFDFAKEFNYFVRFIICIFAFLIHAWFVSVIQGSLNRSLARLHNISIYVIEQDENDSLKWKDLEKFKSDKTLKFKKRLLKPKISWAVIQLAVTFSLLYIFYSTTLTH